MADEDDRKDEEPEFMEAPEDDSESAQPADDGFAVPRDSNGPPVMAPMPRVEGSNREVPLPGPQAVAPDDSPNRLPAGYEEAIRGPGSDAAPEHVVPLPAGISSFRKFQSLDSNAAPGASPARREIELPIEQDREAGDPREREQPSPNASLLPGGQYLGAGGAPIGSSGQSEARPIPRIQVMVTMANAQSLFDQALEKATAIAATKFQKLVKQEIAEAEFWKKCEARAADYRLRGPTF